MWSFMCTKSYRPYPLCGLVCAMQITTYYSCMQSIHVICLRHSSFWHMHILLVIIDIWLIVITMSLIDIMIHGLLRWLCYIHIQRVLWTNDYVMYRSRGSYGLIDMWWKWKSLYHLYLMSSPLLYAQLILILSSLFSWVLTCIVILLFTH